MKTPRFEHPPQHVRCQAMVRSPHGSSDYKRYQCGQKRCSRSKLYCARHLKMVQAGKDVTR